MGVVYKKDIIEKLSDMYPEFTVASLKKLVDYGTRKLVHHLNNGDNVLLNGSTAKSADDYDGVLFCEDVSFNAHIEKQKVSKLKRLNRDRVNRFNKKKKANG